MLSTKASWHALHTSNSAPETESVGYAPYPATTAVTRGLDAGEVHKQTQGAKNKSTGPTAHGHSGKRGPFTLVSIGGGRGFWERGSKGEAFCFPLTLAQNRLVGGDEAEPDVPNFVQITFFLKQIQTSFCWVQPLEPDSGRGGEAPPPPAAQMKNKARPGGAGGGRLGDRLKGPPSPEHWTVGPVMDICQMLADADPTPRCPLTSSDPAH